jgi:ABC-type antimicrobial peptide transport system ATPase subunit
MLKFMQWNALAGSPGKAWRWRGRWLEYRRFFYAIAIAIFAGVGKLQAKDLMAEVAALLTDIDLESGAPKIAFASQSTATKRLYGAKTR